MDGSNLTREFGAALIPAICLHEGRDLRVLFSDQGGDLLVVTFTKFSKILPAGPFAADFLQKYGISFIAVQALENHWYNTDELLGLRGTIDEIRARFGRVVTYGASMGGHGALLWADFFGADRAVLVAPQFSIDPAIVPGDKRWEDQWLALSRRNTPAPVTMSRRAETIVMFDPLCRLDALQARHFLAWDTVKPLHVCLSGHGPLGMLRDIDLLSQVTQSLFAPTVDLPALKAVIHDAQRGSARYWIEYAAFRYGARNPAQALGLAEQSAGLVGGMERWYNLFMLAVLSKRAGHNDKALDYIQKSVTALPNPKNVAMASRLVSKASPKLLWAEVLTRLTALFPAKAEAIVEYALMDPPKLAFATLA